MAKAKKIRREIEIGGVKRWISGNTEQEYAENLIQACAVKRIIKRNSYPPRPGRMEVNKNAGWRAHSCETHPKTTKKTSHF